MTTVTFLPLLQENGEFILQENGELILTEHLFSTEISTTSLQTKYSLLGLEDGIQHVNALNITYELSNLIAEGTQPSVAVAVDVFFVETYLISPALSASSVEKSNVFEQEYKMLNYDIFILNGRSDITPLLRVQQDRVMIKT